MNTPWKNTPPWVMSRNEAFIQARIGALKPGSGKFFVSYLIWKNMAIEARIETLERNAMDPALAIEDDIFDVLNDATRKYLAAWQMLINDGTVWFTAGEIGKHARSLRMQGLLLAPRGDQLNFWNCVIEGRDSLKPDAPGTVAFVKALMGARYADWIKTI
jgi:hypothetical protein